jgi:predicted permease
MVNFLLIAFCIGAGLVFRRLRLAPANAHTAINSWVLNIALPAVALAYVPRIRWSADLLAPALAPVLVWLGSCVFSELYCRRKGYGQRTRSTLELASGYSNTSFIGFPLVAAYLGEEQVSIAVICDQVTFMLLATAGIIAAVKGSSPWEGRVDVKRMVRRLLRFPPFLATAAALVLPRFVDLHPAMPFFEKLAATVAPLALFSVGLQLQFKGWRQLTGHVSTGLFYKLVLAPALVAIALVIAGIKGNAAKVSLLEAGMPTLISASLLADQYHLNTKLINLIVGFGIILGLLTTALWVWLMPILGL